MRISDWSSDVCSSDLSDEVQRILEAEDIEVLLSAEVERVEGRSSDQLRVLMHTANSQRTIEGTDLLVAAGRTPNTQGMGLEEAGIELTDRGYIRCHDRLETTAPSTRPHGKSDRKSAAGGKRE